MQGLYVGNRKHKERALPGEGGGEKPENEKDILNMRDFKSFPFPNLAALATNRSIGCLFGAFNV